MKKIKDPFIKKPIFRNIVWVGQMGIEKSVFLYEFQNFIFDLSKKCNNKKFLSKNQFFWHLGKLSMAK